MDSGPELNAQDVAQIISYPRVDSTNLELARLMSHDNVPPWTVVVADQQTAGRGRQGRTWVSEPGTGVWMSVLVELPQCPAPGWLPLVTGACLSATVQSITGVAVGLKWPNDVVIGERKLAGILIESVPDSDHFIVGVGVNGESSNYPGAIGMRELLPEGSVVDSRRMIITLVRELRRAVQSWESAGWSSEPLHRWYSDQCISIGSELVVSEPGQLEWAGVGVGVDSEGHLLVRETGTTNVRTVVAADVIHATIAPCTPRNS